MFSVMQAQSTQSLSSAEGWEGDGQGRVRACLLSFKAIAVSFLWPLESMVISELMEEFGVTKSLRGEAGDSGGGHNKGHVGH